MRKMLRVGLDLDGVFADFNGDPDHHGFARLLVDVTGRDHFPRPWLAPVLWNWWRPLGYLTSDSDKAWREVTRDGRHFWATLAPLPGAVAALAELRQLVHHGLLDPYFLTTRPGASAHAQSCAWLVEYGFPDPHVISCPNADAKGVQARLNKLEFVIDDHGENLLSVKAHSTARIALFDQPWSEGYRDRVLACGALPLRSHAQMLDKLKEWAGV